MSARDLVSDDPYATCVRLLQAGADLTVEQAQSVVTGLDHKQVLTLAWLADSYDEPPTVLDRLVHLDLGELTTIGMAGVVSQLLHACPGRWR